MRKNEDRVGGKEGRRDRERDKEKKGRVWEKGRKGGERE